MTTIDCSAVVNCSGAVNCSAAVDVQDDVLSMVLPDESALAQFARVLAGALTGTEFIALYGPLGAGKTTLARALLRAAGHVGPVRSPTFTLVEPYELEAFTVLHLDLYRLAAADELEWLGVRERFGDVLLLIEWPERGAGWLPMADLELRLDFNPAAVDTGASEGRVLQANARSPLGRAALRQLAFTTSELSTKTAD